MEQKNSKIFDKKIIQSVTAFCSTNNIEDVDDFIYRCFKQGFDIERFGLLGNSLNVDEKHLIKEVPVDRVIEKEIYITDNNQVNELGGIVAKLEENIFQLTQELESEKQNFSTKTTEMENFFQDKMSKKDIELDELRHNLDVKLDNTNEKMLEETLQKLRKELKEKTERIRELEKINQDLQNTRHSKLNAVFLRGSNLNDTI